MKQLHHLRQRWPSLRLKQEGITRHIGLLLIVGSLLATAGITVLLIHVDQCRTTEHVQTSGATLTRLLAHTATHYLDTGQDEALQQLMNSVQDRQVVYGAVVNAHNRIVAHTDVRQRGWSFAAAPVNNTPAALELSVVTHQDPVSGQALWHFSLPIDNVTDHLGTLHLVMQAPPARAWSSRLADNVALVALIIFLLVPTVYYCLHALLRPMQQFDNVQLLTKPFSPTKILRLVQHLAETNSLRHEAV